MWLLWKKMKGLFCSLSFCLHQKCCLLCKRRYDIDFKNWLLLHLLSFQNNIDRWNGDKQRIPGTCILVRGEAGMWLPHRAEYFAQGYITHKLSDLFSSFGTDSIGELQREGPTMLLLCPLQLPLDIYKGDSVTVYVGVLFSSNSFFFFQIIEF